MDLMDSTMHYPAICKEINEAHPKKSVR